MRYTIAKENEVKELAKNGKSLEYITSVTGIPPKVVWNWCPELRPHEDVIKWVVKQRFHFLYPDLEAKISSAFSPFVKENISEDEWEEINKVIYNVLYEESLFVFKNAITDPPTFSDSKMLSNEPVLDYFKKFWTKESNYCKSRNLKESYINQNRNSIHFWFILRTKKVKDITKGDIELVHENLQKKNLSESRIIAILKTGLIPLKAAYKNGMTLLKTYEYQLPKIEKRIMPFSQSQLTKILNSEWKSMESYLANLIGCQAKMQLQEVRALTLQDIFTDGYIYASHIYNHGRYTENPKKRMIKISTTLVDCILKYTSTSPYKDYKPTDFIFYSINRDTPASAINWSKDLKDISSKYVEDISHVDFSIWV